MDVEINEKRELCRDMRAVVKFDCLGGKAPTKAFEKMKSVYSDVCLSRMQVFALHKEFLENRETADLRNT